MSLISLRECPIEECYYNKHPVRADRFQVRNHIRLHDYQEKLETAYRLEIITSLLDKRAPQWLDEKLTDFTEVV